MRHLDLFSGIGGFALGLRMAGGFETVGFCEIDPYCQRVLTKNFPGVPIHGDITALDGRTVGPVDLITGGFPCQDISVAGLKAGIGGKRSGLWSEYARLIGEIRPRYVLVENVAALLGRGLSRVLGNLAEIGYDAEWHCVPACAVGAPHIRDRVWVIAYPNGLRRSAGFDFMSSNARSDHWKATEGKSKWSDLECWIGATFQNGDWGLPNAEILGMDDGVSARLDRLKGLGNAVVPQVVAEIARAIINTTGVAA